MQGYSGFFSEVFSVVSQKLIQGIVYFVRGVRSGLALEEILYILDLLFLRKSIIVKESSIYHLA